jgi:hypothetical protein
VPNDIYLDANRSEGIIKVAADIVLLIILVKFHRSEHTVREWTLVYLSTIRRLSKPPVTVAEKGACGLTLSIKARGNSRFIGGGTDCYCTEETSF